MRPVRTALLSAVVALSFGAQAAEPTAAGL
jgi:hypothetical protein